MRYTLPMLLAARRIERELEATAGCERYANVLAGPRELFTLSIWRDASGMRECMQGGTHGAVIWTQPHWLDSYWGMRWRPGAHRSGEWEGDEWQWPEAAAPEATANAPSETASWMLAAIGGTVQLEERKVTGAAGATYRLRMKPLAIASALRDLRRLRRLAAADGDTFKLSLGLGTGGALYLLVIATSREALERLRATPEHERFVERWGDRAWCSTWEPEAEFGQWRSRRLRDGQLAGTPPLLHVRLLPRPDASREARKQLRCRLAGLDTRTLELLELLTSELVANSARHAGLESTDEIGLQVSAKPGWMRAEVIDRGRRFEPRVPLSKSPEDGSGWGLFMVNEAADRWGISHEGSERHVWFELRVG